jgi:Do/DeqQ family serine protease
MTTDYGTLGRKGAAAGAVLLTGVLLGYTAAPDAKGTTPAPVAAARETATRTLGSATHSYAQVVDAVTPAVVTVRSERRVRQVSQQVPDEWMREFFGGGRGRAPQRTPRRQGGLGSGVIVRADGYVLTNHHVIDGAEQVDVELTDGRSFKATVVGSDAASDLAVLKIAGATNLRTLPLGDSDAVAVGDVVLAVGNPLGVGQTVTMGIVSAKGRATGGTSFEDFIQTDAPINQGNSGGPLVNVDGQLVGINSQILSPSGGSIGIGFSIPANMARNVMTQLIETGTVRRGMLGVTIQPVTSDIARSLGLDAVRGALINGVQPGGPAAKAGLRRGDVITRVNGEDVRDGNELRNRVAQARPGAAVPLEVIRDGKTASYSVTLGELTVTDADDDRPESGSEAAPDTTGYGMGVQALTPEEAREMDLPSGRGVVVRSVNPDGRAAAAGLRDGDVIEEVDGAPVSSVDTLRARLGKGDRPALLLVRRGETAAFYTV